MNGQSGAGETAGVGSLVSSYAEEMSARTDAPAQQNLALRGSGLCGDCIVTRIGDQLTFSVHRAPGWSRAVYITTLLTFAFGLAGAMLTGLPLLPWARNALTYQSDAKAFSVALTVAVAGFALSRAVASFAGRGAKEDVTAKRSDLRVRRSGRQYVVNGPLGRRGKRAITVLKPGNKADKQLLEQVLA